MTTVVAYSRDEPVIRIVVVSGMIAIGRKIITYRADKYATPTDALVTAAAYALLLGVLTGAFYLIRRHEMPDTAAV
ncbi:phosphate-starvation-inducible PsiE family protein [Halorutilales archaeon Cl-col2-1]